LAAACHRHGPAGIARPRDTLLFDLDGTLTDTDALHVKAYQTLLAPLGRTVTHDQYKRKITGAANEAIMAWLFPETCSPLPRRIGSRRRS
jgi:phosphoglycolate phosphatase-like HAD superfamily hydrolase